MLVCHTNLIAEISGGLGCRNSKSFFNEANRSLTSFSTRFNSDIKYE